MNTMFRKSLMAGAVAALFSVPAWAAGYGGQEGTSADAPRTRPLTQSPGTAAQSGTEQQLYSMTPQQLENKQVYGATGEQIGEVTSVVRGQDQQIHLVVSSGGMMGVGGEEVAVSLDEFQWQDGKLHLNTTQEELQARTPYMADRYVELQPADQPISDFAAFEPMQEGMDPSRGTQQQDFRQNPILQGPEGRIRPIDPRPGDSIYEQQQ